MVLLNLSFDRAFSPFSVYILLTKTTAVQNEDALSFHKLRGLYFLAVIFATSIVAINTITYIA